MSQTLYDTFSTACLAVSMLCGALGDIYSARISELEQSKKPAIVQQQETYRRNGMFCGAGAVLGLAGAMAIQAYGRRRTDRLDVIIETSAAGMPAEVSVTSMTRSELESSIAQLRRQGVNPSIIYAEPSVEPAVIRARAERE